MNETKEKIAF